MLEVKRDGTRIRITIATDLPHSDNENDGYARLLWEMDCDTVFQAELWLRYVNKRLGKLMQRIRREAYDEGYRDGRHHTAKKVLFRADFGSDYIRLEE